MKRFATVAAATGLLATSVVLMPPANATPSNEFTPAPINWGPCDDEALQKAGAECGMLDVPLDYADPEGEKISLAVSRVKAKVPEQDRQGVVLANPGGPGGSGLKLATLGSSVPKGAGDSYDWIGFDPRGVGSSEPSLSCDPNYFEYNRPDYEPTTPELENEWLDRAKGYAQSCEENGGKLLDHIKTVDSVQDMDSIRKALGEEKINYYGFSYGTYLGQVYSTMFPERMRRVVMDGVINVEDIWYQANQNQDVAFDRNMKFYFDWVARYDAQYHLGKTGADVERTFYEQKAKLDSAPAGGKIGSDELVDLFLDNAYRPDTWESAAEAFSAWVHEGEWQGLKDLYDDSQTPGDDNTFAVYNAVQCTDLQWPQSWDQWKKDNWATHAKAPFNTWGNAWYNASCREWPAAPGTPVEVDGSKVDSALLIAEELDGPTPFPGALEARKRFPNASLLSLPGGTTHSGSLSGNKCEDDIVADYLATGALPERKPEEGVSDATCAPLPQPVPEGAPNKPAKPRPQQPEVLREALSTHRF